MNLMCLFFIYHSITPLQILGQIGLMSVYETLFSLYGVTCSQILVTDGDFQSNRHRESLRETLLNLMNLGVLPIVNENDAVSSRSGDIDVDALAFSDNDALASLIGGDIRADLIILLSDVEGLYNIHPSEPGAKIISTFRLGKEGRRPNDKFVIGEKSTNGRGGMGSKVEAAQRAVQSGVRAVVIASGLKYGIVRSIVQGHAVGTLFVDEVCGGGGGDVDHQHSDFDLDQVSEELAKVMAVRARAASRKLQALSSAKRAAMCHDIAQALVNQTPRILAENQKDLDAALALELDSGLLARLELSRGKLETLAAGIHVVASMPEPIGEKLTQTELASGLVLTKETCPIGVLLIIFESRPDSLVQIAALALRSGNGLLLKGGKEARRSNKVLYDIITDVIASHDVPKGVFGLVESRDEVSDLLTLDSVIDLCIPRGSLKLVKYIKENTRIPVLGHAEGVCHLFIDKNADVAKAVKLAVDSKTDYPAACNALETLLLHRDLILCAKAAKILLALHEAGVTLFAGPKAKKAGLLLESQDCASYSTEYGSLELTVEIVDSLEDGIDHINAHGSHHTDGIVTENLEAAEMFLKSVDSACVFHNASTRFADGYRFGLGAEVGISTGRIHARGPVGLEGLLTTKYLLRSVSGHAVMDFKPSASNSKPLEYTHQKLKVIQHNAKDAKPRSSRL